MAPNDVCPFGDEYVRASATTLNFGSSYTTCTSLLNFAIASRQSPNYYCTRELSTSCCQTCKRNIFFQLFLFIHHSQYIYVVMIFLHILAYNAMTCFDSYYGCSDYSMSSCSSKSIVSNNQTFAQLCPRYCVKCPSTLNLSTNTQIFSFSLIIRFDYKYKKDLPLPCRNSTFLCQNGGTCFNTTVNSFIGFKCSCKPGFYGTLCENSN